VTNLIVPNCGLLEPASDFAHSDYDARGIIKIFEEPQPHHYYVMGVDPTHGLANWNRELRTDADLRTDNGAIEIIRRGSPDIQACEYAAPITPEDLAYVANFLGRLYCGSDEAGMAYCIIEITGPGGRTQLDMVDKFSYYNMYRNMQTDTLYYKQTSKYGWQATQRSIADMWGRASRHIHMRNVTINSPWLIEEMANISMRPDMLYGEGVGRKHDDRVRAFMLALWALRGWTLDGDFSAQEEVRTTKLPNFQAMDYDVGEMEEACEDMMDSLRGGD